MAEHLVPVLSDSAPGPKVPFGRAMREAHFGFAPYYTPLNHGSYGTYPRSVAVVRNALLAEVEQAPDPFIGIPLAPSSPSSSTSSSGPRPTGTDNGTPTSTSTSTTGTQATTTDPSSFPFPSSYTSFYARLAESRTLAAGVLNCATRDLVFVPNATTGVDTVLKNLRWAPGDVVLVYEVVYTAVRQCLQWLVHTAGVRVEVVAVAFPATDDAVVDAMVGAARRINSLDLDSDAKSSDGKENKEAGTGKERVRLAIIDTVVSLPGLRVPFERLVPALQAEGALVLVDAAHGIGQIDIDLRALRPDFLVTNLHKWFFVPRGCAALYVDRDRQRLVRTSLPTSAYYRGDLVDDGDDEDDGRKEGENAFVELFDFIATTDVTNWLTVKAAIDFRNNVCGGERAIQEYCKKVALEGAEAAASILGTEIMRTEDSCMLDCALINVRLPLEVGNDCDGEGDGTTKIDPSHASRIVLWIKVAGIREGGVYFQTFLYRGHFYWRLSGMIYVDVDDFRRGAEVLRGLCERIRKGEYLQ